MYTSSKSKRNIMEESLGIRQAMHLNGKTVDAYPSNTVGDNKLKMSAVMDAMINAADVAHTMQSFGHLIKWSKRLYKELLQAYHDGRNEFDPSENWYRNQIHFYDGYIIPLARKLQTCGVFGEHGKMILFFAMDNKRKWVNEGQKITDEMIESVAKEILDATCESCDTPPVPTKAEC